MQCHYKLKYIIMFVRGLHFILIKNPFLVVYSITNFSIYQFLRSRFDGSLFVCSRSLSLFLSLCISPSQQKANVKCRKNQIASWFLYYRNRLESIYTQKTRALLTGDKYKSKQNIRRMGKIDNLMQV